MAQYLSLDEVKSMASQPGAAASPKTFSLDEVKAMQDRSLVDYVTKRQNSGLDYGVRRGLRDALDTGAEGLAALWDKGVNAVSGVDPREYEQVKQTNDAARSADVAGRPVTPGAILGYVGGNALPTTGILRGGQLALNATRIPALQTLGSSIMSGGMQTGTTATGLAARAGDMATRMVGGGIGGFVGGGLADPESAGMATVVGAALPPVLQGARAGTRALGGLASSMRPAPGVSGADMRAARDIAAMTGADPSDLVQVAAIRDQLRQQGPRIIPGQQSVPEILQSPGVSQLQRSVAAVNPSPFVARGAERELARREVLERVAPIGNVREVAEEVGGNIADYARGAHAQAKAGVSAKFGAVDPFNDSRVLLPIEQMQRAKDKFLGPGTFGSGGMAQQAINEAQRIGTQTLPGVKAAAVGRQPQDILQAVRKLGGINPASAGGMNREIAELGRRQTGTTGLVSGNGRTIDEAAELLHERGFLSSPDPSELLDAMRGSLSGQRSYGADLADDAFRGRYEAAMGDAPEALQSLKPVTFEELQNLRSSIGEQARIAARSGNAKEQAALVAQRQAIDDALDNLAAGKGQPGEYFAPDMVANYRDARSAHAAKQERFLTGPQRGIFRQGADGMPQAQGAEIPRKFFNQGLSQVNDAQSFQTLVASDPRMVAELRRYAVSDAAGQVDRFGNLTSAKFNRWLESRQGAIGETFTTQQRAWLKAIAEDLRRADLAESLGRSSGSDTAQKAASMMQLGLMDSPAARFAAGRIPGGSLIRDYVAAPARAVKAERFSRLLMDPEQTGNLLDVFIATQRPRPVGLLGAAANPAIARGAPGLLTGPQGY